MPELTKTAPESGELPASQHDTATHITFAPPPLKAVSATALYIFSTLAFGVSAVSALLAISYIYCPAHIPLVKPICEDEHYKYLLPLLVPVTAWFAIANWVGWEYFRFA